MIYGESAGIDIGSRSIELIVISDGEPVLQRQVPTTYNPLTQCADLVKDVRVKRFTSTGYGRKLFVDNFSDSFDKVSSITEILAYARGAKFLHPEALMILDIGGQDTKAISLDEKGNIRKFEMNDRCAAGTGKFLETMALAFQVPVEKFGELALGTDEPVKINSMCTVFAESETIGLMSKGASPESLALGLHLSIVNRTFSMLNRVGINVPLVFAGGVAKNPCMKKLINERLYKTGNGKKLPVTDHIKKHSSDTVKGARLIIPDNPDMLGALGAAL